LAGDLSDDLRSDYRRELIGIYDSMSRFDDAIHVLRSWIKEGQEASGEVIDLLRGALVAQYGRAKRAGEILDEVRTWLEADPDEDTQRMLWRDALHNAEAFDECIRWELTWLEEDPLNHNRQERLVETLDEAKKYEEALELVHTFEESADSQWASRFAEQRALVLDSAGRSEEAARKMGSMIIEADNPRRSAVPGAKLRLYQMQCAFLISAGKVEEAISTLSRLHRETDEPAEKYVYLNLISTCHQATGRLSQQAEALELAYQISPADAGVNNDLGYTWTELGKNLDKAESMIRAALADDPLNPAFLDSMGWICYKKGRFKEAKKWLQRASFPTRMEDPVIHDHLGDTLWRMGESDLAKTHWQKASKLASEQLSAKPAPMNEPDIRAVMESTQTKVRQLDQGETPSAAALASELPANQATDSSINNDKAMEGSES
jgi:tetratricopeptide (TPR) repeat protein